MSKHKTSIYSYIVAVITKNSQKIIERLQYYTRYWKSKRLSWNNFQFHVSLEQLAFKYKALYLVSSTITRWYFIVIIAVITGMLIALCQSSLTDFLTDNSTTVRYKHIYIYYITLCLRYLVKFLIEAIIRGQRVVVT